VTVELDPVLLVLAVAVVMEAVAETTLLVVATALAVMGTATVAPLHLAVMMMTTTVVGIVPRPELAPQSTTTRLPVVVVSMIPIAATTLPPILMSMADHLHEITLPEITLQETPATLIMIVVLAIGKHLVPALIPSHQTYALYRLLLSEKIRFVWQQIGGFFACGHRWQA
jgi:hypothetical protein